MIEKFEIIGLFGDRNISIDFQKDENIKILVGENGTGKTHILNILYYMLSGKLDKLVDIEFEKIILKIKNIEKLILMKKDVLVLYHDSGDCYCRLKKYLSSSDYYSMQDMIKKEYSYRKILTTSLGRKLRRRFDETRLIDMLIESISKYKRRSNLVNIDEELEVYEDIQAKVNDIKDLIAGITHSNLFIYLPTYRRVEADLEKLGLSKLKEEFNKNIKNDFIQFGMDDIKEDIENLTKQILKSSQEGLSKFSGNIINDLLEDTSSEIDANDKKIIKDIDTLNIILTRTKEISEDNKKIIINKVKDNEIFNDDNIKLLSHLTKLIKIYNQQKDKDALIKSFINTCNKYLVDKNFFYDEHSVDVSIRNTFSKNIIKLEDLSSGEKQLVSILARIYLSSEKDFIIFIDEPEISMSMEWQKMILSDILNSKKCKLLFTTTHSPFIFDDAKEELINHTIDIVLESTTDYIKIENE